MSSAVGAAARDTLEPARADAPPAGWKVLWHDLECGGYDADLPLWRELAAAQRGPILDLGAGTGRVALELAREGWSVTALEIEAELLAALERRRGTAAVETVCADARSFALARRDFSLCLVPMHTIQLLDAAGRAGLMANARAHMRAGALLACALTDEVQAFDCARERSSPPTERVVMQGRTFTSSVTRMRVNRAEIVIERQRRVLAGTADARPGWSWLVRSLHRERELTRLFRISARELEREGAEVGLTVRPARVIEATDEHEGSVVVILGA